MMDDLKKRISDIKQLLDGLLDRVRFSSLLSERDELSKKMNDTDFWQDNQKAGQISKQHAKLDARIEIWQKLINRLEDCKELIELNDKSLSTDLAKQLDLIEAELYKLRKDLRYNSEYDERNAIVSIFAGAGGTDAQDWASMLFRMYVRYCENHNMIVKIINESAGEEAGIKSVTFEVDGDFAYGKLKGEHGVHRLVRQSPFNSASSRETSFARVEVVPYIEDKDEILLDEKDLKIDVFRSGGHGGQSVNTTDSAVRVTHLPTGIVVSIQNERSQIQNRELAISILASKLAKLKIEQHKEKINDLKGPTEDAAWGNQIRNYVLHPYKQVKDLRTKFETSNVESVLDGKIDELIESAFDLNL